MELKNLQGFVLLLILVSMVLGVGLIVLDKFSDQTRSETSKGGETLVISGGTGTLAEDEVIAITQFTNDTEDGDEVLGNSSVYNITLSTGVIVVDGTALPDGDYFLNYTHYIDTTSTTGIDSTISASTPIATTWLPLIVTVAVLAIILGLVIHSFAKRRR